MSRMRAIAEEYCRLIEGLEHRPADWLERLNTLLPRLHAAVASLAGNRGDGRHYLEPNLDARFELYTRLRDLLGDRDSYWMEFDGAGEEQCKSGSLADDLTDIYCELKYGLTLLDTQPDDPALLDEMIETVAELMVDGVGAALAANGHACGAVT